MAKVIDEKDDEMTGETRVIEEGTGREVRDDKEPPQRELRPSDRADIEEDQGEDAGGDSDDGQEERAAADPGSTRSVNAAKRARRREAMERDRATIGLLKDELDLAKQRLAELEKRGVRSDFDRIDQAIERARVAVNAARVKHADAVKNGDGEAASEALEALTDAKMALNNFQGMRARGEAAIRQAQNGGGRATRPSPEHEALARQATDYGENWKTRNTWWGRPGNEVDTAVVDALDSYVLETEKLDPATPEYWERLDELIAERLPHRVQGGGRSENGGDDGRRGEGRSQRQQPRSRPPSRRSDPSDGGGDSGGYTPTAAQIAAARDAGLWDTPEGRKRAMAYFRKADREARERGDR